nr:DNA-binding response regulator [Nostoc sp. DedSLP01]
TIKLYPTGSRLITVQFILNKHPIFSRVMCLLNLYLAGSRGDCRPLNTKTQERILGYQSGCDLYLPKPFELEELAAAIRNLLERSQIIQSEYRFSHKDDLDISTSTKTVDAPNSLSTQIQKSQLQSSLTHREQEVLELLTHGLSNAEMGNQLHLSPRTVEKYVSSLLRKTSTSNRAELVRFAIKHGLVE